MKRLLLPSLLLIGSLLPAKAQVQINPYQIGMQYCQMVDNGVSRKKAWNYIIDNIATGAVNNAYGSSGDPYAPWSPQRTFGGSLGFGIGTGISQGIMVGSQLRRMKPDIERVIQNNCPAGYVGDSTGKAVTPEASDKSSSSYCTWNPWSEGCKDGSLKRKQDSSNCLKAIQKYDCKYSNYLKANPHMQDWVNSNPEMARKEALRLKAVDADEIGEKPNQIEIAPPQAEKVDAAETCLKAADYKGCMEYNKSN